MSAAAAEELGRLLETVNTTFSDWLRLGGSDRARTYIDALRSYEHACIITSPILLAERAAPFVDFDAERRNALIVKAGFEVLPHRSRECKCINSKRADMRRFTDADWQEIEAAEAEIGKTMFRPHRHMGAKGAAEVRRWANSEHGKYSADAPAEENLLECVDTFGGCGS